MGRGKGKAKRSPVMTNEDGSGEEEKQPVKRRGRPTKAQKEEAEKLTEKTETKLDSSSDNGSKRKKSSLETEESPIEDEDGVGPKTNGLGSTKGVGFRHNGSRRKNKPRRAAEVGVSFCEVCSWVVLKS